MSRPVRPSSPFVKPTLETRFHIDYEWWERSRYDLRVYLRTHLCEEHRAMFESDTALDNQIVDWVDPQTGEVSRVDGLQRILQTHCCRQPNYVTDQTSLVDAVFRVFIANGNRPLTPEELAAQIGRPAHMILRTLSGSRVYQGIRPYLEE